MNPSCSSTKHPQSPTPKDNTQRANEQADRDCSIVRTGHAEQKGIFRWTVQQFSNIPKEHKQGTSSPIVKVAGFPWALRIYPGGSTPKAHEDEGRVASIFLYFFGMAQLVTVSCTLRLIQGSTTKAWTMNNVQFAAQKGTHVHRNHGWPELMLLSELENNFVDSSDALRIECELRVCDQRNCSQQTALVCQPKLHNDLATLFASQTFTDLDVICGTEIFKAHMCILRARSSVFKKLIDSLPKPAKGQGMSLRLKSNSEHEPRHVRVLLEYIYGDEVPLVTLESSASALLRIAHEYKVSSLQKVCEAYLSATLRLSNVVSRLLLADELAAAQLKSEAISLLLDEPGYLSTANGKQILRRGHSKLIAELCEASLFTQRPSKKRVRYCSSLSRRTNGAQSENQVQEISNADGTKIQTLLTPAGPVVLRCVPETGQADLPAQKTIKAF